MLLGHDPGEAEKEYGPDRRDRKRRSRSHRAEHGGDEERIVPEQTTHAAFERGQCARCHRS
ncbi:MAG TPA: hypothetical protein VK841_12725, partial [Polyangiaceae bacterium]|nr:hypothetical protein [Polyangiaceae bacterium]